ncbi:hypothetical protein ACO0R3_001253 [Hanseniaspora guilliermondii]
MLIFKRFFSLLFAAAQLQVILAKIEFDKWDKASEMTPFYACKVATTKTAMYCKKDTIKKYECQCKDVVAFGAMSYCAIENDVNLHHFVSYFNQRCNRLNKGDFHFTVDDVKESYNNVTKYIKKVSEVPKYNATKKIMRTPIAYEQENYNLAYKAYYTNRQNHSWGIIFGLIFLGFWLFYFVMLGLYQLIFKMLRPKSLIKAELKLKKVVFVVFSKVYDVLERFHIPIDPNEFNFTKSVAIGSTMIILLVGSLWNYHSMNNNYLWPKKTTQIARYIADRTGYLSVFPLNLSILLASRNNFLLWCTGWNLADMIFFHKFLGLLAVILASAHGIAYWIFSVQNDSYTANYKKPYWRAGIFTIIAGAAIVILSNHRFVRKHFYEIFYVVHVVLAVVFVAGLWYHLNPLDLAQYVIPYIGVWSLEKLFRFFNMFVLFGGYRKNTAVLYEDALSDDKTDIFIKININNYNKSLFKIKEGNFGFLYLGLPFCFWQSHPFTFVKLQNSDDFAIVMKVKKGISMKLYKKFKKLGITKMNLRVCIEGPYGHTERDFTNKHDQLTIVTTGTGVAGPMGYLSGHRASNTFDGSLKTNVLNWGVRSPLIIKAFEDEIKTIVEKEDLNVKINIYCRKFNLIENIKPKKSSDSSSQSTLDETLFKFNPKIEFHACYMNAKDCVDESFKNHESSVIMTCGLMAVSYQVKKQYMANIIEEKGGKTIGFIDESQSW